MTDPRTFADVEEILAGRLTGYESRPAQQSLAHAVEEFFQRPPLVPGPRPDLPTHLIGQAGCGTGKSLAYLIPAVLSGKKIVVSVTTKALQDQLSKKDLPFLEEVLPVPFTWAVLKGRGNYFCANRAMAADTNKYPDVVRVLRRFEEIRSQAISGTRDDFGAGIDNITWAQVCGESDECSALKCKGDLSLCYA